MSCAKALGIGHLAFGDTREFSRLVTQFVWPSLKDAYLWKSANMKNRAEDNFFCGPPDSVLQTVVGNS